MKFSDVFRTAKTLTSGAELTPVVYTMGKVASSSISAAMEQARLPRHHIHTLSPNRLIRMSRRAVEENRFPAPHICESMAWRSRLFSRTHLCLYITLVRDPIARNLSAFFENIEANLGMEKAAALEPKQLLHQFVTTYKHDYPLTWFDDEFRDQLGIDVFARPFEHEQKYVHLRSSNTIIFRVDCDDQTVSDVLTDVIGRPINIGRENDGQSKQYSGIYKATKKVAKFPPGFVNKMYDNKYVRHFWTPDEIAEFKAFWTKS